MAVTVDRPAGSRHPDGDPVYPINYGYLPGTDGGDGDPLDAYLLGPPGPVTAATGRVIAVVHRRDDVEDKLVVATGDRAYPPAEIAAAIEFQERYFDSRVLT